MHKYQKDILLRTIREVEEYIDQTRAEIASVAQENAILYSAETLASYSAKLNGFIRERRGICIALNLLGYTVTWDNDTDRVINIEEAKS